ncbi:MAG: hypothetical protein HXX17_15745 [Geobacteraceae bacterium]|nr:hypothetical protein [Geobacteraceae bacterium]
MGKTVFNAGDKSQGIKGTKVTAGYLNAVQSHRHDGLDQDGSCPLNFAVAAGTANALTLTLVPALTAHVLGMPISFKASLANTGACTININGLGVVPLVKRNGAAVVTGDIIVGGIIDIAYDGVNYQVVSGAGVLDHTHAYTIGSVIGYARYCRNDMVTCSSAIPVDGTVPQVSEGTQVLALTYTPKSATSKILIMIQISFYSYAHTLIPFALFKDSTPDAIQAHAVRDADAGNGSNLSSANILNMRHEDNAGSTIARTYSVRVGTGAYINNNGTMQPMGGAETSSIIILEIAQ